MRSMFRQMLELIRFSHTIYALPFALLSAWLAWQTTPFRAVDLTGILLCMIFGRSAAMAFNRLVDRRIDAANPRTQSRHLPAGLLSVRSVVAFTGLCCLLFVASTLLFLPNKWPIFLSVPVLLFLLGYSLTKRFTPFCHYWLSAALMLSPIAAWIAITGSLSWTPMLIAGTVFFWVGGFDIIYACQDADFDRQHELQSIPARWGIRSALRIARLSHATTIVCLLALWQVAGLGPLFAAGVVLVALLLVYEHWLVRPNDLRRVNIAFFQVNALISLGLLTITIIDRLTA